MFATPEGRHTFLFLVCAWKSRQSAVQQHRDPAINSVGTMAASPPSPHTPLVLRSKRKRTPSVADEQESISQSPAPSSTCSPALHARTRSAASLTPRRQALKRVRIQEELDDLNEEATREANFARQTAEAVCWIPRLQATMAYANGSRL